MSCRSGFRIGSQSAIVGASSSARLLHQVSSPLVRCTEVTQIGCSFNRKSRTVQPQARASRDLQHYRPPCFSYQQPLVGVHGSRHKRCKCITLCIWKTLRDTGTGAWKDVVEIRRLRRLGTVSHSSLPGQEWSVGFSQLPPLTSLTPGGLGLPSYWDPPHPHFVLKSQQH
ncbi:hypothetical protein EJ02DRAFT_19608 [Clathrospora elynae]|uniref:Uncharacterized protein n=1 Tax=Clathrospora elynae TaxID=706981 RepID=A0A6A5SFC8_9PLEO|nr:hypothetical protein EJ02DRAFT_19608 [Clathrospora elynae]